MVFLFKQSRTFVVVRVPVWAQLPPCCHRAFRNKALITVALSVCAANNQMCRRKNIAGKVTRWEQKQLQYVSLKFCHLEPELLFAFAIAQHIIATVGFPVRNNYDILYSSLSPPPCPFTFWNCVNILTVPGVGDGQDKRGGWGDEKKTEATLTAGWGNQKTRCNQKYHTRQSKDSPRATASNQKHPLAIKEPFSAIAVHTHRCRRSEKNKSFSKNFPSVQVTPCVRAPQLEQCGRRKIIEEIHHQPALMCSSGWLGKGGAARIW